MKGVEREKRHLLVNKKGSEKKDKGKKKEGRRRVKGKE